MYLVVVMSPGPQNIVWKLLLTKTTNSLPFFSSQDKTLNVISDGLPKSCSWTLSSSKTISFYHDPFQRILRIILFGDLILKWKKMFLLSPTYWGALSKIFFATHCKSMFVKNTQVHLNSVGLQKTSTTTQELFLKKYILHSKAMIS